MIFIERECGCEVTLKECELLELIEYKTCKDHEEERDFFVFLFEKARLYASKELEEWQERANEGGWDE